MRILVITPYFQPVVGGSQNYIVGLFRALRQLDRTIQVDVITYNTEKVAAEERIDGLRVYRVPAFEVLRHQFAIPNYCSVLQLVRKLNKQHVYDVVNSHTRFFENTWWAPIVAKYLHTTSILTDHCAAHPSHANRLIRAVSNAIDFLAIKLIIPRYDLVTTVSTATKAFLEKQGVRTPIIIVPGGVNVTKFTKHQPVPRSLTFLRKITKKSIVIAFVGRLISAKGVRQFLTAAQEIAPLYPFMHFVIAGNGELYESVNKSATSQIHVAGALDENGVAALLQRADILVHPSTHHEGLPLTLLEAGAAGCAVIATPVGETKHLLANGRGFICQPTVKSITSRVKSLVTDRKRMRTSAAALQTFVQHNHTWQQSAEKFQHILITSH